MFKYIKEYMLHYIRTHDCEFEFQLGQLAGGAWMFARDGYKVTDFLSTYTGDWDIRPRLYYGLPSHAFDGVKDANKINPNKLNNAEVVGRNQKYRLMHPSELPEMRGLKHGMQAYSNTAEVWYNVDIQDASKLVNIATLRVLNTVPWSDWQSTIASAPQIKDDSPDHEDGHDWEGFPGGCERMGCQGKCAAPAQPTLPTLGDIEKLCTGSQFFYSGVLWTKHSVESNRPVPGDALVLRLHYDGTFYDEPEKADSLAWDKENSRVEWILGYKVVSPAEEQAGLLTIRACLQQLLTDTKSIAKAVDDEIEKSEK